MMTHVEALAVVREAFRVTVGRLPSRSEAQILAAMGLLETGYGAFLGGHNWGAVTAGSSWQGKTFEHADSKPGPDGKDIQYVTKFRAYTSDERGCADMIKIALSYPGALEAASAAKVHGYSFALFTPKPGRQIGYYSGLARFTPEQRVWRHSWALYRGIVQACLKTRELLPNGKPVPATLRRGSRGTDVLTLRGALDCPGPDSFDSHLEDAVELYQERRLLGVDGVVGPSTWGAIFADTEIGALTR